VIDHYQSLLLVAKEQNALCRSETFGDDSSLERLDELMQSRKDIMKAIDDDISGAADSGDNHLNPKEILQEIIKLDQESNALMEAKKQEAAEQLRRVKSGKRSVRAYEPSAIQYDGYFIDRKK